MTVGSFGRCAGVFRIPAFAPNDPEFCGFCFTHGFLHALGLVSMREEVELWELSCGPDASWEEAHASRIRRIGSFTLDSQRVEALVLH